jgi:integrase
VFKYQSHKIQTSVKRSFKTACVEAGIENFRFHDCRHTFVTNMRRAGKQDRVIMAITGHKTFTVFTRYDTVSEEDLLGAVREPILAQPNGIIGVPKGDSRENLGTNLAQQVGKEERGAL